MNAKISVNKIIVYEKVYYVWSEKEARKNIVLDIIMKNYFIEICVKLFLYEYMCSKIHIGSLL